jgi:hypothetical protein
MLKNKVGRVLEASSTGTREFESRLDPSETDHFAGSRELSG